MSGNERNNYVIASPDSTPPTSSSYWVVPGLLLAGAYPGDPDPDSHIRDLPSFMETYS